MHPTRRSRWHGVMRVTAFAGWVCCLFAWIPRTTAQIPRQIDRLAEQAAKKAAQTDARSALIYGGMGCAGLAGRCDAFDTEVRADLEKLMPGIQFIPAEQATKYLAAHGFLSVDAYLGALDDVAYSAGAELVIREERTRRGNHCELHATVGDAKHLYVLAELNTHVPCDPSDAKVGLSLLKDPQTGVAVIVPSEGTPAPSLIRYPSCVKCPAPHYTGDARYRRIQGQVRIALTVTTQGTVENPRVLGAVDDGLAHAAIAAVSGWIFKPATDADGMPFADRLGIEMLFKIL